MFTFIAFNKDLIKKNHYGGSHCYVTANYSCLLYNSGLCVQIRIIDSQRELRILLHLFLFIYQKSYEINVT